MTLRGVYKKYTKCRKLSLKSDEKWQSGTSWKDLLVNGIGIGVAIDRVMTNFETQVCSRCHGSGNYSSCSDYGTRCFKCAGAKVVLTKRGVAAKAYLERLCTKRAIDLVIGDRVACTGLTNGGKSYSYIGTVSAISSRELHRVTTTILRADGYFNIKHETSFEGHVISSGSTGGAVKGVAGIVDEMIVEVTVTTNSKYGQVDYVGYSEFRTYPANKVELIQQALTYQDTLTKTGNVRKLKGKT